jgi:hypothetical protein
VQRFGPWGFRIPRSPHLHRSGIQQVFMRPPCPCKRQRGASVSQPAERVGPTAGTFSPTTAGPRPWRPGCSTTTLTTLGSTRRTPTNQPPATNLMAVPPSHLRHRSDCSVPAQWPSAASGRSQRVDAELTSFSTAFAGSPTSTKHAVVAHCRLGGPTGMHLPAARPGATPCMSRRLRVGRHCSG